MPITASSGALTYAKATDNVNPNYWFIQPSGATLSDFNFLLVDSATDEIYVSSNDTGLYSYFTSLSGLSNPTIKYLSAVSTGSGSALNLGMQFIKNSSTEIKLVGTQTAPAPQFPNPNTGYGTVASIDPVTGTSDPFSETMFIHTDFGSDVFDRLEFRQIAKDNAQYWYAYRQTDNGGTTWLIGINLNNNYIVNFEVEVNAMTGGLKLDSNGNPIILYNTGITGAVTTAGIVLQKIDKTPTGTTPALTDLWTLRLEDTSLYPTDLQLDSTDNSYYTFYDNSAGIGYLVKVNTSGTLQWQRAVSSTRLFGVVLKSDTEIYVIGVTSTNKLWVAEFNDSGTVQWQNEMIGSSSFENVGTNYDKSIAKIDYYDDNLYLGANGGYISGQWSVSKVPADGTIVGNGEYVFPDGSIITYQTSSQTVSTSTLTSATTRFIGGRSPQNDPSWSQNETLTTPAKAIAFPLE